MRHIIFLLSILLLTSCASLFNKKTTEVNIVSNTPTKIIINDSIASLNRESKHRYNVPRSHSPLKINITTDSLDKTIFISSRLSPSYIMNIYSPGILSGFWIDYNTDKKFTYPRKISLKIQGDSLSYKPKQHIKKISISDSSLIKNKNIISILPLKLSPIPEVPKLELTYEYRFNNKFSIQAEYLHYFNDFKNSGFNVNGGKVGLEIRKYRRPFQNSSLYYAIHIDHLRKNYNEGVRFFKTDSDWDNHENYIYDTARINRKTNSLNLKLGFQTILKHFVIDSYFGLGVKYRDVKHNIATPSGYQQTSNHRHDIILSETRIPGSYFRPNFLANIKLGYSF